MHRVLIVLLALCGAGVAHAQMPGHGAHPLMPNQELFLRCGVEHEGAPSVIDTSLALDSFTAASELNQQVELPAPFEPLRVKRYLPKAVMRQETRPAVGDDAKPIILLKLEGPTQSFERWLVAGDEQHNRLTSFIGTWRYMSVGDREQRDSLFKAFAEEFTREPMLIIGKPGAAAPHRVSANKGDTHTLDDLNCKLRVKEFFPNFAFDEKQAKPVNQSAKRINPAALVEFTINGQTEERWLFAKFPDFNSGKASLPLKVQLDCPIEPARPAPDFAIVTVKGKHQEVWTRHDGRCGSKKVALNQPVEVIGSNYKFHIAEFIPAGRLTERYEAGEGKGAQRALSVEFVGVDGTPKTIWLAMGKTQVAKTANGDVTLWFGPRTKHAEGATRQRTP